MRSVALFVALATMAATPARAAWLEASTRHFIVDADTSEQRLRDFATRLEHFDVALRMMYGVADDNMRPANRVRVFAVNETTIGKLCEHCGPGVRGFSTSRPGGSVIYTATLSSAGNAYDISAQTVLLFNYTRSFSAPISPASIRSGTRWASPK